MCGVVIIQLWEDTETVPLAFMSSFLPASDSPEPRLRPRCDPMLQKRGTTDSVQQ